MSADLLTIEAQRERWRRYRRYEHLTDGFGDEFARGGLGRHVEQVGVRAVLLPADPEGAVVPLNSETLDWLKADRAAPYGSRGPGWGGRARSTSDAIVRFDQYREDRGWDRFLALHRHGGLEFALGNMPTLRDGPMVFRLRQIVGCTWALLALQQETASLWPTSYPLELSIGLRNTGGQRSAGSPRGGLKPASVSGTGPRASRSTSSSGGNSTRSTRNASRWRSVTVSRTLSARFIGVTWPTEANTRDGSTRGTSNDVMHAEI